MLFRSAVIYVYVSHRSDRRNNYHGSTMPIAIISTTNVVVQTRIHKRITRYKVDQRDRWHTALMHGHSNNLSMITVMDVI